MASIIKENNDGRHTGKYSHWFDITHEYSHSINKVWAALTNPSLVQLWSMRPEGYKAIEGTTYRLVWTPSKMWRGYFDCEVLEVKPQSLLRYAWDADGKKPPLIVTFTLNPTSGGTRLTMSIGSQPSLLGKIVTKLIFGPGMKREVTIGLPKVLNDMDSDGNLVADSMLKPLV